MVVAGRGWGGRDGYSGASVEHTLDGYQAAETALCSGLVYLPLAYRETALERFPKETQQCASTPLGHHAGRFQMHHAVRASDLAWEVISTERKHSLQPKETNSPGDLTVSILQSVSVF